MPFVREPLQISTLDVDSVNKMLSRIQEYLDELKGLRNEVVIHDTINASGFKIADENGTVIHGIGSFEE